MSRLILAVDVGNSTTSVAVFKDAELISNARLDTDPLVFGAEWRSKVRTAIEAAHLTFDRITHIGISSVVPTCTDILSAAIPQLFEPEPFIINAVNVKWFKTVYSSRKQLGGDRVCKMIAAAELYGAPLAAVDFGTATTVDLVGRSGEHLGGVIIPGIKLQRGSLSERTAQIKLPEDLPKVDVLGSSTRQCVNSGVILGTGYAVEGIIKAMWGKFGEQTKVIATGGSYNEFDPPPAFITRYDPYLVLNGIRIAVEKSPL